MSKPNRARYKLSEVRASYAEAVGGDHVEIETDDGTSFTFLHPMFTDDEFQKEFQAADGDTGRARLTLGDQYDKFIEHGGSPNDVVLLYVGLQNSMQDTLGKHRPPKKR